MALYKIFEREYNGYDDSDFYATVYDSDTDTVREIMTGTTRGYMTSPDMLEPTQEILERFYKIRARQLAIANIKAYIRDHYNPFGDNLSPNTIVQLKTKHTSRKFKTVFQAGTTFTVLGVYASQFRRGSTDVRVQASTGQTFYLPIEKLRIAGPFKQKLKDLIPSEEERIRNALKRHVWAV